LRPAFATSQFIVAGVSNDAHEPGFKTAATEAAQRLVGRDERLLTGVGRRAGLAHYPVGDVVDRILVVQNEGVVGADVALLRLLNEIRLVHRPGPISPIPASLRVVNPC
jgi:hypothetical protein